MIDSVYYDQVENWAKQNLNSWRTMQAHHPHVFAHSGFPINIKTFRDLRMLIDTMQENRFDKYMNELNGISDDEFYSFMYFIINFIRFYNTYIGNGHTPIPLSTMLSHFALYKKIAACGRRTRILEIGPGCGYLSFFLSMDNNVENYCQIEATQSFYLMQHIINIAQYGESFVDHVALPTTEDRSFLAEVAGADFEISPSVFANQNKRCEHFPWWKVDMVAERRFDIVTSNANFNEFSEAAFRTYAALIARCLTPDGVVLAQCVGGGPLPLNLIVRTFESLGFAVLFFAEGTVRGVQLAVPNMLLVREGHPLFSHASRPLQTAPFVPVGVDLIERMFFSRPPSRMWTRQDVISEITQRLKDRP